MARWERAEYLLQSRVPEGASILDLGCAFGYGTSKLARHYTVTGMDASQEYIERAQLSYPHIRFLHGSAEALPFADASFDAAVMLDVLEHVSDEAAVLAELARVLKPGGWVVISVPHRGLLAQFDSLNVYERLRRYIPGALPTPEIAATGVHKHYSVTDLRCLLGPAFTIRRVIRTGIGLVEFINVILLVVLRGILKMEKLYQLLQYIYFGGYIAEDILRFGRHSYHLMVMAQKR